MRARGLGVRGVVGRASLDIVTSTSCQVNYCWQLLKSKHSMINHNQRSALNKKGRTDFIENGFPPRKFGVATSYNVRIEIGKCGKLKWSWKIM